MEVEVSSETKTVMEVRQAVQYHHFIQHKVDFFVLSNKIAS